MLSSSLKSGYDPATGICWNFQHAGERNFRWDKGHKAACPVCSGKIREHVNAYFGRCRSAMTAIAASTTFQVATGCRPLREAKRMYRPQASDRGIDFDYAPRCAGIPLKPVPAKAGE
jgi:hypothetical protein